MLHSCLSSMIVLVLVETVNPILCRFSNCKLAVQSKLGLQRLAQLGYYNVHRLYIVSIYIKSKSLLSVCLSIITRDPLDQLVSNFDWKLVRTSVMFLVWFWNSKFSRSTLKAKISFPVKSFKCRLTTGVTFSNSGTTGFPS